MRQLHKRIIYFKIHCRHLLNLLKFIINLFGYTISMLKKVKKLIVAIIGFTILLIGVVVIFTPGPAIIIIPVGLAVLATEFVWAQKLLDKFKAKFSFVKRRTKRQQ